MRGGRAVDVVGIVCWFLVDKSGGGGLDDWEVKTADFVVLLGKDAEKGDMGPWIYLRGPGRPGV